ncbi:GerAB/ArcD/ProY family transporter [Paenibacillus aestuarii]|uniref:GerAB/ArcD/ProY family transporter n=1 Tax=Paenibacillus aestuarii TaxID=516965 RepID=A0ABW0K7K5_9BACL
MEKITGTQLSLLIFPCIAPTVILVIPGLMAKISKQDAWMTILPASLIGALSIKFINTFCYRNSAM